MYLQPKVDLKTEKICSAEALVRWKHPTGGLRFPGEFLPYFENNGFIMRLDEYMWECAAEYIAHLAKKDNAKPLPRIRTRIRLLGCSEPPNGILTNRIQCLNLLFNSVFLKQEFLIPNFLLSHQISTMLTLQVVIRTQLLLRQYLSLSPATLRECSGSVLLTPSRSHKLL